MKRLRQYVHEQIEKDPGFAAHLEQARAEVQMAVAVARLREQRGLSQRDLARQTGIKQPQIARLEKGDRLPTLDTLWRLLDALGARIELSPHGRVAVHPIAQRAVRSVAVRKRSRKPAALVSSR
jgi:transcriptional regulator with XRE-family HTH domain